MYLAKKGYYEVVIPQMNYIVIFDVRKDIVNIVGIFHQLENYLKPATENDTKTKMMYYIKEQLT